MEATATQSQAFFRYHYLFLVGATLGELRPRLQKFLSILTSLRQPHFKVTDRAHKIMMTSCDITYVHFLKALTTPEL